MAAPTSNTNINGFELALPFNDSYKLTNVFIRKGKAWFGLWNPPPVVMDGDEETFRVQQGQEGQLDLFAFELYGDRSLWKVIAHANKIDNVAEEVVSGMVLKAPKLANINAALQQQQNRGTQTVS